jgi:hypothetical protein
MALGHQQLVKPGRGLVSNDKRRSGYLSKTRVRPPLGD